MSFRRALVEAFKSETTISCFVKDRVFDRFYRFEDLINAKANRENKFPAITIEQETWENENNLDKHDGLTLAQYRIICYTQINQQRLKSRKASVRKAEEKIMADLDNLGKAVINFILDKREEQLDDCLGDNSYYIRSSHILDASDEEFESDDNREIPTVEIIYEAQFNEL